MPPELRAFEVISRYPEDLRRLRTDSRQRILLGYHSWLLPSENGRVPSAVWRHCLDLVNALRPIAPILEAVESFRTTHFRPRISQLTVVFCAVDRVTVLAPAVSVGYKIGGAKRVTAQTRYARSGDLSIAYQVVGKGPIDVVFVPGFISHAEIAWEMPTFSAIYERISSFARLITFDKRGMGLSDRTPQLPTLEERMDDVRAVMDAAGSERAALIGISEGGPMSLLFSATYPERTAALVLWATYARVLRAPDYPVGVDPKVCERAYHLIDRHWGEGRALRQVAMQDAPDDPLTTQLMARYERNAATPSAAVAALRFGIETDVRHILSAVSAPTLVVHHTGDPLVSIAEGRYLADHIAGARLVEFPGDIHLSATGADAPILDAIEHFLTGSHPATPVDRVLKTILVTDIVDSTERAAELGDRRWRALLDAHDRTVRREIGRARGREVKTTGDGFLAAFDGPARAIRCAQAIAAQTRALGLEIRAGLHSGECEMRGDDLAGIAVHIAARVAALAAPGELLVTGTVRDLVAGSGIEFEDRGTQQLKGVPGEWQLLAARG